MVVPILAGQGNGGQPFGPSGAQRSHGRAIDTRGTRAPAASGMVTPRARLRRAPGIRVARNVAVLAAVVFLAAAPAVGAQAAPEVFAGLTWVESGDTVVARLGRVGFAPLGAVTPGNVVFVGGSARDSQFVVATLDTTRRLRQVSTLTRAGAGRVLDVYQEIVTALSMKHGPSEHLAEQSAGGPSAGTSAEARVAMRKWTLRRTTIVVLISPRFDVVVAYDPVTPPSNRARLF